MQTKLTLRMEAELIGQAKDHAARSGKSVSQLVADYFSLLEKTPSGSIPAGSVTSRLRGSLRGIALDESDYRRHLEEKYR